MVSFDDLDDLDSAPTKGPARGPHAPTEVDCTFCNKGKRTIGFRNVRLVDCNVCRGTGKVSGKRLRAIQSAPKREATRRQNLADALEKFQAERQDAWVIMYKNQARETPNEFLMSLYTQLVETGRLSDRQLDALDKCVETARTNREKREAEQAARGGNVITGAVGMLTAFHNAKDRGIKRPKLRVESLVFSLAPSTGANTGCVYVKTGEQYLGKINPQGNFLPIRECTDEQRDLVIKIGQDPLTAAVAYGKKYGICSCCGRELENAESIELGIGPICRSKFF